MPSRNAVWPGLRRNSLPGPRQQWTACASIEAGASQVEKAALINMATWTSYSNEVEGVEVARLSS